MSLYAPHLNQVPDDQGEGEDDGESRPEEVLAHLTSRL